MTIDETKAALLKLWNETDKDPATAVSVEWQKTLVPLPSKQTITQYVLRVDCEDGQCKTIPLDGKPPLSEKKQYALALSTLQKIADQMEDYRRKAKEGGLL